MVLRVNYLKHFLFTPISSQVVHYKFCPNYLELFILNSHLMDKDMFNEVEEESCIDVLSYELFNMQEHSVKTKRLFHKVDELRKHIDFLNNLNADLHQLINLAEENIKYLSIENNHLKKELHSIKEEVKEKIKYEKLQREEITKYYENLLKSRTKHLAEMKIKKELLFKRIDILEEKSREFIEIIEKCKKDVYKTKRQVFLFQQKNTLKIESMKLAEDCFNNFIEHNVELSDFVDQIAMNNEVLRKENFVLRKDLTELQNLFLKNEQNNKSILNEFNENLLCGSEIVKRKISSQHHSVQVQTVSTDLQKSIEVKSGSLPKGLLGSEENVKICHSSDVRDQINEEIRALREQLVRSQVLFTYLLKDGSTEHTSKNLDYKTHHLRTLLEEGNLSDVFFQCKSFDGQVPARFYNRSNRSSSSYASHRSTPMHCGYTSQSCPILPIESPVVTKSTQTEPVSGITFYTGTGANGALSATSSNSLSKGNLFLSPPSTPCEPVVVTDVCEVHQEPEEPLFPRHRTNSFLSAVKEGNPNLVDITSELSEKTEDDRHFQYSNKKSEHLPSFIENGKTKYFVTSMSKVPEASMKAGLEENKPENVEKKQTSEYQRVPTKVTSEHVKSNNDGSDAKSENNREKFFKSSQRSMRRSSATEGSPNSQLTIPRYPAFDYGEQEDAQSLFPSPSEPEANRNIKAELLQVMKGSDLVSESDTSQSASRSSKETQKKRDSSKSKSLMPELMENSETESAKGSFECEAPDLPPSVDAPPVPVTDIAFPSLPNTFLAKLGVHKDSPIPVESFDEQELESKFIALSLAFKTDRTTLSKRIELHKRQRDMAEKNVEKEFKAMREHLNALNLKATKADVRDLISKIQNHLDIAQQATARVSGRSETYGAVQQEERVSKAFEVLVLHVDHLKRLFDKEHKELEETRRMLTDTQAFRKELGENISEDQKKYLKSYVLPTSSIKSVFSLSTLLFLFKFLFKVGRRRASVADFHHSFPQDLYRSASFNQSWSSGYGPRRVEPRSRTLYPFATTSSPSSSSLSTSQVSSISPTRKSTDNISARRCSLPTASPLVTYMLQNNEAASKSSNVTTHSLSFPDKQRKRERSFLRKLSAVSDEMEQDGDDDDDDEIMELENKKEKRSSIEIYATRFIPFHILWTKPLTVALLLCILLCVLVFYIWFILILTFANL